MLDVNFKGFDAGKDAIPEPTLGELAYREFLGDDGTEEHASCPAASSSWPPTACRASLDLKDHGLFTQVVLDGLKGEADKEGYEPDGLITVDELAKYLDKELPRAGPQARQDGRREGPDPLRPRRPAPTTSS